MLTAGSQHFSLLVSSRSPLCKQYPQVLCPPLSVLSNHPFGPNVSVVSYTVTTLLSTLSHLPHRHRFQMTHYPSYLWSPPGLCFRPFFCSSIFKCIMFTLLHGYGYNYHGIDDDFLDRVVSKFRQTIQNLEDALSPSFQSISTTWSRQHSFNSVKTAHLCSIFNPKDTEPLVHAFITSLLGYGLFTKTITINPPNPV